MGQNDVEDYNARKMRMQEEALERQQNRRVIEPTDDRIFITEENLDDVHFPKESHRTEAERWIKYNRGVVWLENGKLYSRCPVCNMEITISSVYDHVRQQHAKRIMRCSNKLEDLGNGSVSTPEPETETERESDAVDVFDRMRRLKENYPRLFESLTGEQLKLILEAD